MMIQTVTALIDVINEMNSKGSKVVYFARSMNSGYLVSRDEFFPPIKSNVSKLDDKVINIYGKKIECNWSMYIFSEIEDAISAGKAFTFTSGANFIEVAYDVIQCIDEWHQKHHVYEIDDTQNIVTFGTTHGIYGSCNSITDHVYNHMIQIPFDKLESVLSDVNFNCSPIESTFDQSAVYSNIEYNKTIMFRYLNEYYEYNIGTKKLDLIQKKEEIDNIPVRKIDFNWKDCVEFEDFPGGRDAHNAKKVGRKIKATRDGKFYVATVKTLNVSRYDEHYINENGHHSLDEWYDMSVEWNEYEECSKEDVKKIRSDFFTRIYSEDFWKVFYRFASKEEYEAAYDKAYGDGTAIAKATKLLEEKINNFNEVLESEPFATK